MPLADKEDLIAFRRKMHAEGAAGFGAGPWGSWDDGDMPPAIAVESVIDYTRASNDLQTRQHRSQDTMHLRAVQRSGAGVATALVVFSLVALLAGTAGVYLTRQPDEQLASIQNDPVMPPDHSAVSGGTPLPADDHRAGILAGRVQRPADPLTSGKSTGHDPAVSDLAALPEYEAAPAFADNTEAPTAPITVAGVFPGDSGTRTLVLPLPRSAARQAVSTAVPPAATAFSTALPAAPAGHGDRFTSPWEQVPPAVAVTPNILPAPAAGGNSTRTNTGIILRHDPEASPLIPISATVPARKQDAAPAKQIDPAPALQVPAKQAEQAPALQAAPQQSASADKPVRPRPGRWSVVLGSYSSKKIAQRMLAGFRDQGIPAELQTVNVDGATMHRIRVRGYRTKIAALTGADDLNRQPGIDGAWITKR